ncbi:MAG: winged helix-turn-helix domain-containing protein [Candidatus Yanofskybacteria bacterium]|nr:winged helix-turn-helix domain-containing protein [Candidatus Yanofskybacteria bacterium]
MRQTSNGMEKEDILKFTNTIIVLSKLFTTMEDRFLKQKLHGKLSDFVFAFVTEQKNNYPHTSRNLGFRNINNIAKSDDIVQRSTNVVQYHHRNLLNSINNLLDHLEYLAHISKDNTTPLLVAQRNLLKFKFRVLQKDKKGKVDRAPLTSDVVPLTSEAPRPSDVRPPVPASGGSSGVVVNSDVVNSAILISRPAAEVEQVFGKQGPVPSAQRKKNFGTGTTNKEQIFNYIKKTPDIRTKEIMSEFSALSGRTVKRSLKELTDEGFLKKRSDGAAVYYTCG